MTPASRLELWAGPESTCNRVGPRYFDQVRRSGHHDRVHDLDRFAELGIRAIRYPVLWERTAPDGIRTADWSWPDARLARLRELGIRPIVALLHHGSGPRYTDLMDPEFPEKLTAYARAVAERYPWVDDWTPVNEPLTTARFSALYGHWYPHARSPRAMMRAVLNQCRGSILAMEAIRSVNPSARFVSTEDLGRTYATALLGYQADLENERRWLSMDLLTGRFDSTSSFGRWAMESGLSADELGWFAEHACAPDVVGINHYPTSQRYLDERLEHFPEWSHGGNERHRYADVEAVRARAAGIATIGELLREAADRYGRPVAVTECHIWSTREQQLRWLLDTWEEARALRASGVDVRAVTVWALLGSYDWDHLVVTEGTHYESGAFDVRGGRPRPTAIAALARELGRGETPRSPALVGPRWWRSPARITFGCEAAPVPRVAAPPGRPILISGARGTLGEAFVRATRERGLAAVALTRAELDITDERSIADALALIRPWAIVNAAGYVEVDRAEADPRCEQCNTLGALLLARAAATAGARFVTFSTDLVFDGAKQAPYVESDPARPLGAYGRSKMLAELHVREEKPEALIIRTSAFFGPWDEANFITVSLRQLERGLPVRAAEDVTVSPTYVPDLASETLDLLIDEAEGLWHVAGPEPITWAELLARAARAAKVSPRLIEPCPPSALGWIAPRPRYSALGSERAVLLPSLEASLVRYSALRAVPAA